MNRLPLAGFGALAVATLAAFFISQHLKVTTPLIAGTVGATPAIIDPADSHCSTTSISFHLLHAADQVHVSVVDANGRIVRTLGSGVSGARKQQLTFSWNGRLADGAVAPRGKYHFRVTLIHEKRTIDPLINQLNELEIFVTVGPSCPAP